MLFVTFHFPRRASVGPRKRAAWAERGDRFHTCHLSRQAAPEPVVAPGKTLSPKAPIKTQLGWGRKAPSPAGNQRRGRTRSTRLLQLDLGASLFELLLHRLGVGLRHAFLHLAASFDQVL